jgi:ABC-2 type transport system permease protein
VIQISADAPITESLDGILIVLPSSLSQEEMDNLADYIEQGTPALLLVDPLPVIDTALAPSERAGANRNPFMQQQQAPPKEKGDIEGLLARLGVSWNKGAIVWDAYNPHPDLAHLPDEVVFIGAGNENDLAFNASSRASDALQELVFLFPGHLEPGAASGLEFVPLVRTGVVSGILPYHQMVRRTFFGSQVNTNLPHRADGRDYTVVAQVRPAGSESADTSMAGAKLIVMADIDFISQQFFEIRNIGSGSMNFDNVTLFLNAMDVLMGDESFIDLRNRRVRHRTLQRVEEQTRRFIEQRSVEEQEAEAEAENTLAEAQLRLDQKVDEVRQRTDLDEQTKQIMARNLQEIESRRFEVMKASIEAEKEAKIASSKENMESQIRRIQSGIRTFAVLFPPIPVFVLGVVIFVRRQRRAREGAAVAHRLRS